MILKNLILSLLASLCSAQSITAFVTAGAAVSTPTTGVFGGGLAMPFNTQTYFVDLSLAPNSATGLNTQILGGMTQAIPKTSFSLGTLKLQPYTIVAYGTTLQSIISNPSLLASLKTSSAFTQNYGLGVKLLTVHGFDLSLGAKYSKAAGLQGFAYPFFMLSRTFNAPAH